MCLKIKVLEAMKLQDLVTFDLVTVLAPSVTSLGPAK